MRHETSEAWTWTFKIDRGYPKQKLVPCSPSFSFPTSAPLCVQRTRLWTFSAKPYDTALSASRRRGLSREISDDPSENPPSDPSPHTHYLVAWAPPRTSVMTCLHNQFNGLRRRVQRYTAL